jgi:branched-chain amino acid transport system permease protein
MYLFCLVLPVALAWLARNLTRGTLGRQWMAIRDMDIAAEIIGVNPLKAKLSAFAVSSFFVGISGALFFAVYLGAAEAGEAFGITSRSWCCSWSSSAGWARSSVFLGRVLPGRRPVLLKICWSTTWAGPPIWRRIFEIMIIGALIIVFLILEPHGLTALWRTIKEKLRLWPFPH